MFVLFTDSGGPAVAAEWGGTDAGAGTELLEVVVGGVAVRLLMDIRLLLVLLLSESGLPELTACSDADGDE